MIGISIEICWWNLGQNICNVSSLLADSLNLIIFHNVLVDYWEIHCQKPPKSKYYFNPWRQFILSKYFNTLLVVHMFRTTTNVHTQQQCLFMFRMWCRIFPKHLAQLMLKIVQWLRNYLTIFCSSTRSIVDTFVFQIYLNKQKSIAQSVSFNILSFNTIHSTFIVFASQLKFYSDLLHKINIVFSCPICIRKHILVQ